MMEKSLVKASINRFIQLDELDKLEDLADTLEIRWKKLNAILLLARELGINDVEEPEISKVRERWTMIKTQYETRIS